MTSDGPWRLSFPQRHVAETDIDCFSLAEAVTGDWQQSVEATLNYLQRDSRIRSLVLSIGSTVTEAACCNAPPTHAEEARANEYVDHFSTLLTQFEKPIICLLDGICTPSGLRIACAADVRLCTSRAEFYIWNSEASKTFVPELVQTLTGIVFPCSLFREIAFSRDTFSAAEAHKLGLVSTVCPSLQKATQRAFEIAQKMANRNADLNQKILSAVTSEAPKVAAKFSANDAYTEDMMQADIDMALGYYGPQAERARL